MVVVTTTPTRPSSISLQHPKTLRHRKKVLARFSHPPNPNSDRLANAKNKFLYTRPTLGNTLLRYTKSRLFWVDKAYCTQNQFGNGASFGYTYTGQLQGQQQFELQRQTLQQQAPPEQVQGGVQGQGQGQGLGSQNSNQIGQQQQFKGGQKGGSKGVNDEGTGTKVSPAPLSEGGVIQTHQIVLWGIMLAGVAALAVLQLSFTTDISFGWAIYKVFQRLGGSVALRQTLALMFTLGLLRYALEPAAKNIRKFFNVKTPWEKSNEYYLLKQFYRPLELLLVVAAVSSLAENFLPSLIAVPKDIVKGAVRTTLSLTFILLTARVLLNVKTKIVREANWLQELKMDKTAQRKTEAIDKLLTILVVLGSSVMILNTVGLDVHSLLTIGGFGGLAVGLAGREILENLLHGLLIISSSAFAVGDEVVFQGSGQRIEGFVIDVGWYRSAIRSFEREVFVIPNAVFSKTVVLNVTRKAKEWRFRQDLGLRPEDVDKAAGIVADMRRIIRQDTRVIQRLHRRVFVEKIDRNQLTLHCSFYVEAANRDQFMSIQQDLLLAFVDCIERSGAQLAKNRYVVEFAPNNMGFSADRQQMLPEEGTGKGETSIAELYNQNGNGSNGNGNGELVTEQEIVLGLNGVKSKKNEPPYEEEHVLKRENEVIDGGGLKKGMLSGQAGLHKVGPGTRKNPGLQHSMCFEQHFLDSAGQMGPLITASFDEYQK